MKYVAFMTMDKSQFRELRYYELINAIEEHKPYYIVEVDCPLIQEYEEIHFLDGATITLKAEITGVFRTDEDKLCARVSYREHATNIADAEIEVRFTAYHLLHESEIKVTKQGG